MEIIDAHKIEPVRQHPHGLFGFDRLQNLGFCDRRDVSCCANAVIVVGGNDASQSRMFLTFGS
jgi:hypothetical protein